MIYSTNRLSIGKAASTDSDKVKYKEEAVFAKCSLEWYGYMICVFVDTLVVVVI